MSYQINDSYFGCPSSSLCIEPPDPGVAVGPNNVVQSVNLEMRIYNKSGSALLDLPLEDLFGTYYDLGSSDPTVAYMSANGHWVADLISWDCDYGYLNVAVSDTADPTGSWDVWRIPYAGSLPDFPGLGLSSDKVVIGVNQFAIDSSTCEPTDYIGTSDIAFDVDNMLDFGTLYYAYTSPDPDLWDWRPAIAQSSASDVHSIVTDEYYQTFYYVDSKGSVVNYVLNTGSNEFSQSLYDLSGEFAPAEAIYSPLQPSGYLEVDNRVTTAVWRNNRLVFVSTFPCGNTGVYDCVRVSEFNTNTLSAKQDFLLGDSGAKYDNFLGGVSIDANGTLYIVWSRTRNDTPVSIWTTYQLATDGANTTNSWLQIKAGGGAYDGGRWGDFAVLATDPSDGSAIWQAHEFARSDGGWGTYISKVSVGGGTTDTTPPSVQRPTGVIVAPQTLGATATVHMTWSASDTSGIARYDFQVKKGTGSWTQQVLPITATAADLTLVVGATYRFRVRATDNAGNTSAWSKTDAAQLRLVQENSASISYAGTWKRVAVSGSSGGYVKYSTANTAKATLTFKGAAASLVTTVESDRGIATIWIDGSQVAMIDTYSGSTTKKRIVYATPRLSYATHTIQVRVTGTKRAASTSPRIDVDAFLTWP